MPAAGSGTYGANLTTTITDPASVTKKLTSTNSNAEPESSTDTYSKVTKYDYVLIANNTPTSILKTLTYPEGNYVQYGYDGRGNVTSTTWNPKPSVGGTPFSTTATYPSSCSNAKTCNKPTYTIDARQNRTDYTYDATHGGVTSIMALAGTNGIRPTTTIAYTGYADGNNGTIYMPTSVTVCRTQSSCGGGGDQMVTSTDYGSVSNNLLPRSVTKRAGDGSVSVSTSATYDAIGNVATSTDAANAQTTFSYNADRQVTEAISADPDGSGSLKPRAVRTSYNGDGTVSSVENGTDTGGNFQTLQQVTTSYDPYRRKSRDTIVSGGTTFGVTQYSYNPRGWLVCSTVRMNPSSWTSQSEACNLATTGSNGPDRITNIQYDQNGRQTSVTSGLKTAHPIVETTLGYSSNGKVVSAKDANNNQTTYTYDGFDRLVKTSYPDGSNEQLTLDNNGNVTHRVLRDGNYADYGYDALNRLLNDSPHGERGMAYGYDLMGHVTEAAHDNLGSNDAVTMAYNALGWLTGSTTRQGGVTRTIGYGYDSGPRDDADASRRRILQPGL